MEFIDLAHKEFYEEKLDELKKLGKKDAYYRSLIYTLGISETTREHFSSIFDIKEGMININSISSAWQTSTSVKVTRMAFSLWNCCMYDSEGDREEGKMSRGYNTSELFCCSYAPYFWEAIRIRYPEYTRYNEKEKQIQTVENFRNLLKTFSEVQQEMSEEDEEEII